MDPLCFRTFSAPRSGSLPPAPRPLGAVPLGRFSFFSDEVCLRDARALGPSPALRADPETGGILVYGPFAILQRFSVFPEEGRAFVETSGDENPIHVEDSVIPGAMTAARFLLVPEILFEGLATANLKVKFRAFARYDRPSVNVFSVRPRVRSVEDPEAGGVRREPELAIAAKCYQLGTLIAEAAIVARFEPPRPTGPVSSGEGSPARTSDPALEARATAASPPEPLVRAFLASVRVDPERYLRLLGFRYPRAFLAALPSGAMVRRGGAGGLLNVLDLEFPWEAPPLSSAAPPVAEVEAARPRSAFRKVLARVGDGIRTYCKGTATVLLDLVRGAASRGTRSAEERHAAGREDPLPGLAPP